MRILIAEDDFTSRIVLTEVLKKHGHDVVVAVNGAEAWLALQQPDPAPLAVHAPSRPAACRALFHRQHDRRLPLAL